MSNLQLAEQSQGNQLNAGHNEHRGEDHQRPVLVHHVDVANKFLDDHIEGDQKTGHRADGAKTAEEMQRPRHVLEQETDGDEIEEYAEGPADTVVRFATLPVNVANRYLTNRGTVSRGQGRNKAVQFAVKRNLLYHFPSISFEGRAEVVDVNPAELGHQPVRDPGGNAPHDEVVDALLTPAAHDVITGT